MPLLEQYCENVILNKKAAAELRTAPIVDGKPSPWLVIAEKSHRACVALAMRLRLSPQARQPNNPKREPQLSAYEKMRLSNADDG
jgi:hypothetical protein